MKRQVMQQFRPPRSRGKEIASNADVSDVETLQGKDNTTRRSPRRKGKEDSKVHVVPYKKGIKMMSEREVQEVTDHGEVLRWSEDSGPDVEEVSSEDDTQFGVVWERFLIPETEEDAIERTGEDINAIKRTGVETDGTTDREDVNAHGTRWRIEARVQRAASIPVNDESTSSHASSPCLSEFEEFLSKAQKSKQAHKALPNDVFWENVLEAEKKRLEDDINSRTVSVEDIMLGTSTEEVALNIEESCSRCCQPRYACCNSVPGRQVVKSEEEKGTEIPLDLRNRFGADWCCL
jgi:hypothetical protein